MAPIVQNLFADVPGPLPEERFDELIRGGHFRLERIISTGHATTAGQWYDQDRDEWVLVLRGRAQLRFEDEAELVRLQSGDCVLIPAHCRHRVEWTDPRQPTLWLALHFDGASRNP
ncbi:MAG: cupin domain-containing protein [Candidatus Anammoximicrobium sp.]|nr:cupin domain-containing protein [Candidatus Anammoximicrobium sp.]